TINGVQGVNTATINYNVGDVDLSQSTISAVPAEVVADGASVSTIVVQMKDRFGNNLNANVGNVVITGLKVADQAADNVSASYIADGRYELEVTSTVTGVDTVSFKLGEDAGNKTTTITYVAGEVDLAQSTIVAMPPAIIADGDAQSEIIVTLRDSYGNAITDSKGEVKLRYNDGNAPYGTATAVPDNGDGTYTEQISSNVANVADEINFSLNDINSAARPALVFYLAGEVSLDHSTIEAIPGMIVADGEATSTIRVILKDAFGNTITDTNEIGQIKLTNLHLGNVLNDGIFTNVGNGVYEVTVTSTKEGQETLGFTIDGKAATATTPLEYVGDDGIDLNKSTMTATPAAILANNVETSLVVVEDRKSVV